MQAVAAHDSSACEAVARRLAVRLHRLCRLLVRNLADAEDASQSALLAVFDSAGRYEGRTPLEAWADRVCVRVALRAASRQRRLSLVPDLSDVQDTRSAPSQVDFWTLVDRLDEPRRTTTLLRFGLGYSIEEIAAEMETSPNTVKARLKTSLERLRGVVAAEAS
jgi:RNA polymerase sigma-70 factor (ECF subfamily)